MKKKKKLCKHSYNSWSQKWFNTDTLKILPYLNLLLPNHSAKLCHPLTLQGSRTCLKVGVCTVTYEQKIRKY